MSASSQAGKVGGWARRSQAYKKIKKKLTGSASLIVWDFIIINRKDNMNKSIKAEYLPGGAKRQELLEQVPEYLLKPGADQATKHMFCLEKLKLTETEYLEALNKATNGGLVEAAWN